LITNMHKMYVHIADTKKASHSNRTVSGLVALTDDVRSRTAVSSLRSVQSIHVTDQYYDAYMCSKRFPQYAGTSSQNQCFPFVCLLLSFHIHCKLSGPIEDAVRRTKSRARSSAQRQRAVGQTGEKRFDIQTNTGTVFRVPKCDQIPIEAQIRRFEHSAEAQSCSVVTLVCVHGAECTSAFACPDVEQCIVFAFHREQLSE
jgi:hypothetical protein